MGDGGVLRITYRTGWASRIHVNLRTKQLMLSPNLHSKNLPFPYGAYKKSLFKGGLLPNIPLPMLYRPCLIQYCISTFS